MLSKLFKYEIKATARLFIPLYVTILIFAAINRFILPIYNIGEKSAFYGIATAISMLVYVTLMVGLVVMTLFVMIQRFYKNLLGDEGYLMFTLPVKSHMHITSKLTVSTIWIILSGIVAFASILIIASMNLTPEFFRGFAIAFDQFRQYFGGFTLIAGLEIVLICLLIIASTVLNIYAAIALGHLFNKYKLLISFGMYIGLKTVTQILMTIFAMIFGNFLVIDAQSNFIPSVALANGFLLAVLLYYGIITAGCFILTNYILKRKLNLE